jgi:equilibrative nucleoside transporter 1/2/3
MLCNLLFRSLAILTQNNKNLYRRTCIALTIGILIFVGMLTISQLHEVRGDLFFGLTLALLVFESLLGAVINSDGFALSAILGPNYIQACISGQGLAGLGVSIAQFVFAISAQENSSSQDKEQALMLQSKLYFSASLVFMIIATVAFFALKYQPLYKYYHKKVLELDQVMETSSEEVNSPMEILPRRTNKLQTTWQLIAKFWPYMFTVCYSFVISLSLFPSVTAAIPSMSQDQTFLTKYFISIHFLLFNIGDYLGKTIPIVPQLYISHYVPLTLISLLRTLFIPYFLFNNIFLGPNTPGVLKNVFGNDTAFLILVFVFGLTNGYLGSAPMMSAPSQVGLESKSTLSSLMALFLAIGLALGSLVSFGWLAAICNCNPF